MRSRRRRKWRPDEVSVQNREEVRQRLLETFRMMKPVGEALRSGRWVGEGEVLALADKMHREAAMLEDWVTWIGFPSDFD